MADVGRRGACKNKKSEMEECQHRGFTCKAKREAHGAGQMEELPRKALTQCQGTGGESKMSG